SAVCKTKGGQSAALSYFLKRSREDNNAAFHSEIVVQRANVRINTGRSERDTEARRSQWRLQQPNPLLPRGHAEAGVNAIWWRSATDDRWILPADKSKTSNCKHFQPASINCIICSE